MGSTAECGAVAGLSPLFNKREDAYGGSLQNRMRLLLEVISAVRKAVGPEYPVGIKLNAADQLEGGFAEDESLEVGAAVDKTEIEPDRHQRRHILPRCSIIV